MARTTVSGGSSGGKSTYRGSSYSGSSSSGGGSYSSGYDALAAARAAEEAAKRKKIEEYKNLINETNKAGKEIVEAYTDLNSAKRALALYSAGNLSNNIKNGIEKTQDGMQKNVNEINSITERAKEEIRKNGEVIQKENLKTNNEGNYVSSRTTGFSCNTEKIREEVLKPLQSAKDRLVNASNISSRTKTLTGCEDVRNVPSEIEDEEEEINNLYKEVEKLVTNAEKIENQNKSIVEGIGTRIPTVNLYQKTVTSAPSLSSTRTPTKNSEPVIDINEKTEEDIVNKIYDLLKNNSIPVSREELLDKNLNATRTTTKKAQTTRTIIKNSESPTRTILKDFTRTETKPTPSTSPSTRTNARTISNSRTRTKTTSPTIPIINSRTTTEDLFDVMKVFANNKRIYTNGKTLDEILIELAKMYDVETTTTKTITVENFMECVRYWDEFFAKGDYTYGSRRISYAKSFEEVVQNLSGQIQCGGSVSLALYMAGYIDTDMYTNEYGGFNVNYQMDVYNVLVNNNLVDIIEDPNEYTEGCILFYKTKTSDKYVHVDVFSHYNEEGKIYKYNTGKENEIRKVGPHENNTGTPLVALKLKEKEIEVPKTANELAQEILEKASETKK